MKGLKDLLLKEQSRVETIIKDTKSRLKKAPRGSLRLAKSHGYAQYYWCNDEKEAGEYIPKDNEALVQQLAQKSYDTKILQVAEKRYSRIKRFLKDYTEDELKSVYFKEHPERQKFIVPVEPTWEQKLNEWMAKTYVGKEFPEDMPVIWTERGERVRSKSEKIMADYFYGKGIEYKYECPIYLKGMGVVYPDFTFLSRKTWQEIYWEHCGKCDDTSYARKMVRKINAYENSGIFQGERLILTYETEQTILNTGKIEQLVGRYL